MKPIQTIYTPRLRKFNYFQLRFLRELSRSDDEDARILVNILIYQMVHALYDEKLLSRKENLVAMNYNYNK